MDNQNDPNSIINTNSFPSGNFPQSDSNGLPAASPSSFSDPLSSPAQTAQPTSDPYGATPTSSWPSSPATTPSAPVNPDPWAPLPSTPNPFSSTTPPATQPTPQINSSPAESTGIASPFATQPAPEPSNAPSPWSAVASASDPMTPLTSPAAPSQPTPSPFDQPTAQPWTMPTTNSNPLGTTPNSDPLPTPEPAAAQPDPTPTFSPAPAAPLPPASSTSNDLPATTPSSLNNPWDAPAPQTAPDQNPTAQPSWNISAESATPAAPPTPSVPEDAVPTDLSHLIGNNTPPSGAPAAETVVVPATPEVPNLSTQEHKGIPKWVFGLGAGLLLIVIAASAYFILGIGQPAKPTTSLPATVAPKTATQVKPPATPIAAAPSIAPTLPAATGSASFGELQGGAATPAPASGSSSLDLIRQRQQGR